MTTKLPAWADGLQDDRVLRILGAVWARLPAHDRALLAAVIHSATDTQAAPDARALAAIGDMRADFTVRLWLTEARGIADDSALAWVIAHEFAHAAARHQTLPIIVAVVRICAAGVYTGEEERALDVICEEQADILAALVWGFERELRAFLREYPRERRPRWLGEGIARPASAGLESEART